MKQQVPHIPVNGVQMYYETEGPESAPVLFLLHGALQSGDSLEPLRRALSSHFRLIVPDLRGHGETNNPGGNVTDELMAADVAALITALVPGAPVAVCGYSMGGTVALRLAVAYPELVKACVVMGSRHRLDPDHRSAKALLPENVRKAMPQWAAQLPEKHVHTPWEELALKLHRLFQVSPTFTTAELAQVRLPLLVVHGAKDQMVPVAQGEELAAKVPGSQLVVLPNAAHTDLFFRAPAHKAVIQFVAGHA